MLACVILKVVSFPIRCFVRHFGWKSVDVCLHTLGGVGDFLVFIFGLFVFQQHQSDSVNVFSTVYFPVDDFR